MMMQHVILTTPRRRLGHVETIVAAFAGIDGLTDPLVYCDERGDGAAIAAREALTGVAGGGTRRP